MMNERATSFAIDGTAALKPVSRERKASIIPFPAQQKNHAAKAVRTRRETRRTALNAKPSVKQAYPALLASSEMFCSLLFEDAKGCPYHLFSRREIVVASAIAAVIALAAIIIGY